MPRRPNSTTIHCCSICLDPLYCNLGTAVPCGHVFHINCFNDWGQQRCPNCNLQTTHFQKLFLDVSPPPSQEMIPSASSSKYQDSYTDEESHKDDKEALESIDQLGCFVYRTTQTRIGVRYKPTISFGCGTGSTIEKETMVSVDCIRPSRMKESNNGPFLRLSDGSGWVFEMKQNVRAMEPLHVEQGLWGFYADNYPVGIVLRKHPMDRTDNFMEPKVHFRPMQKIVCDRRVIGNDGVSFYRVQGTEGWVFDKRGDDKLMMIPETNVQTGLFVYKALHNLSIRSATNIGDKAKTDFIVKKNELVSADVVRISPVPEHGNGPFLRLTDGSGWLFENKLHEQFMEKVPVQDGTWSFRIANEPIGMALRRQPIDQQKFLSLPQTALKPGEIISCNAKVIGHNGVAFYRVAGTDGWVFDKRGDHSMMLPVQSLSATNSQLGWKVDRIRGIAMASSGVTEICHNHQSRVLSFRTSGGERINVFYTTQTVGTAIDHPVQGKTQLFRRDCTASELQQIFLNPRVHSGRGYKIKTRNKRARSGSIDPGLGVETEEEALRVSLQAFDDELQLLSEKRAGVLVQLKAVMNKHTADALEHQSRSMLLKEEVDRMKKREFEKKQALEKELAEKRLGDNFSSFMFNNDVISLENDTKLMAMGGLATIMLKRGGGWAYTDNMPEGIVKLLKTRASSHPKPTYVSLGTDDRYFIRFENGKIGWSGFEEQRFDDICNREFVDFVAFGRSISSYVVKAEGRIYWGSGIPLQLTRILNGNKPIHSVSLGPSDEYFVAWSDGQFKGGGWSNKLNTELGRLKRNGWHVRDIKFGDDGTYIVRYSSFSGPF